MLACASPEHDTEPEVGKVKVTVKAAGGITKLMPGGVTEYCAEITGGTTVGELLDTLGIPRTGPSVILLNKVTAGLESRLKDGDVVHLLPMVVGG